MQAIYTNSPGLFPIVYVVTNAEGLDKVSAAVEESLEAAQSFMTAFPDLRVVMDSVLLRGDRTEYRWTLIGTNTGPGGTGHRVRISGLELWQIGADGLIASS